MSSADRARILPSIFLSAAGVAYKVNENLKLTVGALYEHFSNGGQTDPNTSLNLFGPQIGATYSF